MRGRGRTASRSRSQRAGPIRVGLSCVCCLTRVTPLPTQRGRGATEAKHISIRRGGGGCRHTSGRRHRRIQTQGFGAHAKRGVDTSGAIGAPSGPRASLPSASRRSGVGTAKRSASGPRASLPASQSGVSTAKRSVDASRAMGAPSVPPASLPSASRRSCVSKAKRSVHTSRAIGAPSGPRESLPSASRRSGVGKA